MTEHFTHDGLRFSYADAGSGPPFVFQHGLGGDLNQPASHAPRGVRLLTLECRGHGQTAPLGPVDALNFDVFARDVEALLDHRGVERVAVGGVSMGAGVALAFARRQPRRTRALVIVRPAWSDQPMPPNLGVFSEIAMQLRTHGPREGRDRFVAESRALRELRSRSPAAGGSLVAQFDRYRAQEYAPVLERLAADHPVGPADWAELQMPALVLAADPDPLHPFDLAATIHSKLPDARLLRIPSKDDGEEIHRVAVSGAIERFLAAEIPA